MLIFNGKKHLSITNLTYPIETSTLLLFGWRCHIYLFLKKQKSTLTQPLLKLFVQLFEPHSWFSMSLFESLVFLLEIWYCSPGKAPDLPLLKHTQIQKDHQDILFWDNPGLKIPAQKTYAAIWLVKNESNIYFGIYRSTESIIIYATIPFYWNR